MADGNNGASGTGSQGSSGAAGETGANGNGGEGSEWHKRLLAQRKADQDRAAQAERERDELKAKLDQQEQARLEAQKQYEDLYKTEKQKREELERKHQERDRKEQERTKRDALKAALGGVKRDDYLSFADLSTIRLSADGTVDADSVQEAAAKFREAHPDLLATKQGGKLPNDAARGNTVPAAQPTKPLHERSDAELRNLLAATLQKT